MKGLNQTAQLAYITTFNSGHSTYRYNATSLCTIKLASLLNHIAAPVALVGGENNIVAPQHVDPTHVDASVRKMVSTCGVCGAAV